MTFRIMRSIHLCAGMFSAIFLLAYAVSAMQMAHFRWFKLTPRVETRTVPVDSFAAGDGRALARQLMDRQGLTGELGAIDASASRLSFRIARPGIAHDVTYVAGSAQAQVKTSRAGFLGTLNRLHHAAGVQRGDWVYNLWGGFVLAISTSLLVLAASGIYLWFARRVERRIGLVLLVLSVAYSLSLIVLLRWA